MLGNVDKNFLATELLTYSLERFNISDKCRNFLNRSPFHSIEIDEGSNDEVVVGGIRGLPTNKEKQKRSHSWS